MKICFVVRSLDRQAPHFTTAHLAYEAYRRGHEVSFTTIDSFTLSKGRVFATLSGPLPGEFLSREKFLRNIQNTKPTQSCLETQSVVFLRYNPNEPLDIMHRHWSPALEFGRLLQKAGVRVLNNPEGLSLAASKMFLTRLPAHITVPTLVTRSSDAVKKFAAELGKAIIVKPLHGFGGKNVFLIREAHDVNLNQMVTAACEKGYLVAQQYVPGNRYEDKRLLLCQGKALVSEGQWAVYQRISQSGEIRSNMAYGSVREKARVGPAEREIVRVVGPILKQLGLFLVGLDLVGEKLIEVNVFCPGGIESVNQLYGINIGASVIETLEQPHDHTQSLSQPRLKIMEASP